MFIDRRQLIALVFPLSLVIMPGAAVAQTAASTSVSANYWRPVSAHTSPRGLEIDRQWLTPFKVTTSTRLQQPGGSRDSLKNGTIIGALIGAAAFGGFAAVICKAQQEPEGPSCVSDTLRIAAIGAAIGAGAGLAVDAALTRQNGVRLSVRIRF